MTKAIRTKHIVAWIILSLVLPPAIGKAIVVLKKIERQKFVEAESVKRLPILVTSASDSNYEVSLLADTSNNYQIEWVNKEVPNQPSAILYKTNSGETPLDGAIEIGRVETKPVYYFPYKIETGEQEQRLLLYDIIHHTVLAKINLKP
jgi:hypothetical protein